LKDRKTIINNSIGKDVRVSAVDMHIREMQLRTSSHWIYQF